MENNNLKNNDDDKTVFLSSSNNSSNENLEKTTINMENLNDQSNQETTQVQNTSKSDQVPQPPTSPINKMESKGGKISGGTFAAGVAGTAVAGAALGATFSEEIENVLDGNGFSAPDSTAEAAEVKPEVQSNPTESIVTAVPVIDPPPFIDPTELIQEPTTSGFPEIQVVEPIEGFPEPGPEVPAIPEEEPTGGFPEPPAFPIEEPIEEVVAVSTENYENIDWASFNDAPATIEDSDYGQELASTDFDNLNNTGGDLDQNLFDPGNEETNNEFL